MEDGYKERHEHIQLVQKESIEKPVGHHFRHSHPHLSLLCLLLSSVRMLTDFMQAHLLGSHLSFQSSLWPQDMTNPRSPLHHSHITTMEHKGVSILWGEP